jgi:hypothetical protein
VLSHAFIFFNGRLQDYLRQQSMFSLLCSRVPLSIFFFGLFFFGTSLSLCLHFTHSVTHAGKYVLTYAVVCC